MGNEARKKQVTNLLYAQGKQVICYKQQGPLIGAAFSISMLRRDQIQHTYVNRTHAEARIPREEFMRMVKGEIPRKVVD